MNFDFLTKRAVVRQLGAFAAAVSQTGNQLYGAQRIPVISAVSMDNWPTAGQPQMPIGPPGSKPLGFPFQYGQNLISTPRPDAAYTAADLKALSLYPLARICIENVKDLLCKAEWTIQLRARQGETRGDAIRRRKVSTKLGDENAYFLSKFFEYPEDPKGRRGRNWSDWLRLVLEDMLTVDAASVLIRRSVGRDIIGFPWTSGSSINCYIDDEGLSPAPPSIAYAQIYPEGGMARVDLTQDDLIYKPRNIVPRIGIMSSYTYGFSPVESIAEEIKIGMARLSFVMAYYDKGSVGNVIHIVPPRVSTDKIREAMQFINSEMSGNFGNRRQWRMIPGFNEDGKPDQIEFPTEPALADTFDDLHIRKMCFAFGTSPQRLQRAMNRSSAQASQSAAQEEGIEPWQMWVKGFVDNIIQNCMGYEDYEITFDPYSELDYSKKQKADMGDVQVGILTRNEVRDSRGLDPSDNPMADKLTISTPNGTVDLGQVIVSGRPDKGGATDGNAGTTPAPKGKPNGKASLAPEFVEFDTSSGKFKIVQRGEQ